MLVVSSLQKVNFLQSEKTPDLDREEEEEEDQTYPRILIFTK